jgi:S1-C subfamily serine protease
MRTAATAAAALLSILTVLLAACEAPRPPLRIVSRPVLSPAPEAPKPQQSLRASPRGASGALTRLGLAIRSGPEGATIAAIDLDGPAAHSGAQLGDVVVSANGAAVSNAAELDRAAGAAPEGPVLLEVLRKGERRQVTIKNTDTAAAGEWNPLGLQVRELPKETLKALGLAYGVMVAKVRAPADRTRILPGDVIVGVDSTPIRSMEEFNRLLAAHGSPGTVGLLVRRTDSDLYIALEVGGASPGGDASRGGSLPRLDETFKTRQKATGTPLRT